MEQNSAINRWIPPWLHTKDLGNQQAFFYNKFILKKNKIKLLSYNRRISLWESKKQASSQELGMLFTPSFSLPTDSKRHFKHGKDSLSLLSGSVREGTRGIVLQQEQEPPLLPGFREGTLPGSRHPPSRAGVIPLGWRGRPRLGQHMAASLTR